MRRMRDECGLVSRLCGPVLSGALHLSAALLAPALLALAGAGCGHNAPPPVDARRVHRGQGALHARAHEDGVVWVEDDTEGKVVWTGPVHRGESVDLNVVPGVQGTLSIAGEVKFRGDLDPGHSYSIYQKP